MKAIVIGTGFLGEQLYKDILPHYEKVILTYNKNKKYPESKKFDFFTDDISEIIGKEKIDAIFIPAKIELTENSELLRKSMDNFLKATKGSRIVYISSDGIFDGKKGLYKENDTPEPITLYGKNLKICEDLVEKQAENFCIIRPSYLYGLVNSKLDSRFQKIKDEVEEGKEIRRFTNMYKSPLSYKQASEAITKAALSDFNGIIHVSGERKSIYNFTKEGMEALGISTENLIGENIPKEKSEEFLSDTSLDFTFMQDLTGIKPISIRESFEKFWPRQIDKNAIPGKYLR